MIKIFKIYSCLFLLIAFAITDMNGQAPGLVGKKLTLGYDANFSFNVYGVGYNNAESNALTFDDIISTKHSFSADYVLTRGLSLGMDYSYARGGIESIESYFSNNIIMNEVGVRLKNFHSLKGGIAPIGFYNQYRLFMLNYQTELVGDPEFFGEEDLVYEGLNRTAYGVSLAYGHQGIVAANVLYNIGFEMGVCTSDLSFDLENQSNNLYNAKNIVNWATFLKFKIGIAVPII